MRKFFKVMFLKTLKYQDGGRKRICGSSVKGNITDMLDSVQRYVTTVFKITHIIMFV